MTCCESIEGVANRRAPFRPAACGVRKSGRLVASTPPSSTMSVMASRSSGSIVSLGRSGLRSVRSGANSASTPSRAFRLRVRAARLQRPGEHPSSSPAPRRRSRAGWRRAVRAPLPQHPVEIRRRFGIIEGAVRVADVEAEHGGQAGQVIARRARQQHRRQFVGVDAQVVLQNALLLRKLASKLTLCAIHGECPTNASSWGSTS